MTNNKLSTSEFLDSVIRAKNSNRISIDELRIAMHERGFGILLMFFALPMSIPIPYIPGMTTFFALPLLFLSAQMIVGTEFPWLPKWLSSRSIKRSTLALIITKSSPPLKRVERLLKPRLLTMSSHRGAQIIGLFTIIFATSIALPLPFTNFIPALAIVIMALGLLSRDGIIILLGIAIGIAGTIFTIAVLVLGKKIVIAIIKSFIS